MSGIRGFAVFGRPMYILGVGYFTWLISGVENPLLYNHLAYKIMESRGQERDQFVCKVISIG